MLSGVSLWSNYTTLLSFTPGCFVHVNCIQAKHGFVRTIARVVLKTSIRLNDNDGLGLRGWGPVRLYDECLITPSYICWWFTILCKLIELCTVLYATKRVYDLHYSFFNINNKIKYFFHSQPFDHLIDIVLRLRISAQTLNQLQPNASESWMRSCFVTFMIPKGRHEPASEPKK